MKCAGFITSIVTNGALITQEYLDSFEIKPDWIGVSIDSFNHKTNWNLGRITNKGILDYIQITKIIKKNNIKLKINTMVNKLNYQEDMRLRKVYLIIYIKSLVQPKKSLRIVRFHLVFQNL